MARQEKHREKRTKSQTRLKGQEQKGQSPVALLEALGVGGLLILGYMLQPTHKIAATWVFFAAWVAVGLIVAIKLTQEYSSETPPPRTVDNKQSSPLETPTPTPMKKDDKPSQSITTTNQSGGQNIIAGGDVHLAPLPRTITSERRAMFIQEVANSPKGKVVVAFSAGNAESFNFAAQIKELMESAGYDVQKTLNSFMPLGSPPLIGVESRIINAAKWPAHAATLLLALRKVIPGVDGVTGYSIGMSDDQDTVNILVGIQP